MTHDAPAWFAAALADEPELGSCRVRGATVRWLAWGERSQPTVVLVHGGAAHARWWSFIAPMLTSSYRVVAPDLTGMGTSDHRDEYDMATWAAEVVAVADAAGGSTRPVVVGHSMGGFVTIVTAATYPDALAGAIVVDSPVRRPDPESSEARGGRMFRRPGVYVTLDEALEHFHLVPPQPVEHPFLLDHVARHSLRQLEDGRWTWRFDPGIFRRFDTHAFGGLLADVGCRVAILHGELSPIVTPDVTSYMDEQLGRRAPFVEIPQAHHHVMLDQPLALVAALRALLADWEHSTPTVPPAAGAVAPAASGDR